MTPLADLEERLRRGDAAEVLRFADPEQARVHAQRLLAADPAARREFAGNVAACAAHLRALGAPHVARCRRHAERVADRVVPTTTPTSARLAAPKPTATFDREAILQRFREGRLECWC